ncbi:carbohydrate binding domain-containing protein [Aestuariivivens sediminicola]|uniref:carbohydrate binding domain-containing protein n=1 Tax=Aestuariivivens sediminicola TaxID=2913560 RepID=UPI001F5741B5|nr:carbohydrate binding domain-containing protein [Aestuariivivens sediminicola]
MKNLKTIFTLFFITALFINCAEDDNDLSFVDEVVAPSEVSANFKIAQDNSGVVTITPNAQGATHYNIMLGDGTAEPVSVIQGEAVTHTYIEGSYNITIEAIGITGLKTEVTQELMVSFRAPENLEVTAEIDPTNPFKLDVSATADFAASFEVYFDTSNTAEEPTPMAIGETVSYEYPFVGDYTMRVVALSGGVETTELEVVITISSPVVLPITFEVFDATKFIGFGGASAEVVDNPDTNGNPSAKVGKIEKGAGEVWAGDVIIMSSPIDFSKKKLIKLDVWSPRPGGTLLFKLENLDDANINIEKTVTLTGNSAWEEVVIDFSDIDLSQTYQKLVWFFDFGTVGSGGSDWTFYVDNIRNESAAPFNDGLLSNGDFEDGSDFWIVGTDDNAPVTVVTDGDNTYYSVDVASAGNPWEVNMSQKVEILQDETYTLIFDAWSDTSRSMVTGIGLSAPPWSASVQTVNITPTRTTYSLTLTASGWGAPDARVLFDMGADAGQVNIDNVSLFLGDGPFDSGLLVNGDFEAGPEPWIKGTNDTDFVSVVTDGGNTYYSVDVATAGNAWEVNMSQKVEITQGTTYTFSFDAWSDTNRSIVSGIGLSAAPWSSSVETVDITPTRTTYTFTLTATDWGAADARVIFDMGADAGQVNIDNVSLFAN